MKKKPVVIMAERSDIYRDARVQKEAMSLASNHYEVEVWGFRNKWKNEKLNSNYKLVTFPIISRRFRIFRNISMALNILIISIVILLKKADYYHSHNTFFLFPMYLSSRIHKGKIIYDSHEVQWERSKYEAFIERMFIKKVDKVINVSKGRAKIQQKRYSLQKDQIKVIANYPVIVNNQIKIKPKSYEKLNCIFSGGFSLANNRLDNFLLALKDVSDINFFLLSFGYGASRFELNHMIEKFKLTDRVQFLPLVTADKVIETISNYDFAVNLLVNKDQLDSLKYPAINKMYEYLAAGLPLFTSKLPSFIDEFENEGVGVSVNADDVNSIKNGLRYFKTHNDKIPSMKRKALELSKKHYNWGTQEKILIDLYSELT